MMSAHDGEVLGLQASGNGRSCFQHHCCGMLVVPNDIIKFKITVIGGMGMGEESKSFPEEDIKVVLIHNGTECCTVSFLCKSVVVVERDKARFVGSFAQIIELYDESANKTMMLKSKRNMGIASFRLLDEIQDQE
jgi:hypothetical protein